MARMTDMQELKKDMKDVVGKVNKIEQHLSDMNGKLVSLTDHTNNKCPAYREEIHKEIITQNTSQNRLIWIAVGGISVIIGVLGFLLPPLITKLLN